MPSVTPARSSVAERYRVLLEIGRTLTGTLAIEDLYRAIYQETARVLEASGFYIATYDPDEDLARVVFYADQGAESRCDITYRGSDSDVIRTGEPTIVRDRLDEQSVMLLGEEESEVTRSAISAPLKLQGQVIGAISTQSYKPNAYSAEEVELLEGIADLSAVAMANARQVTELDRRRREAERVEEIGRALVSSLNFDEVMQKIGSSAQDLLDADGAGVWLIDGTVATCHASIGPIEIPVGATWDIAGPIFDTLIKKKKHFEIQDLAESDLVPDHLRGVIEGGSGLAIPLLSDDRVTGALAVGSRERRAFGPDDRRVMYRLASQASVALENAILHKSVEALSLTDPLTGLPNRRQLEVHLDREVAAARRGRPLCVVVFDLDDFKIYNDNYGHTVGDDILKAFGRVLEAENRAMNLVARFGGDEFVSVLTESDPEGVAGYLRRVSERIVNDEILTRYEVGVSSGMAFFERESMRTAADLFAVADRDMYENKEQSK